MLDFHNHVIPNVDDGSESLDQSLQALANMWSQGIKHVIATPHFRASALGQPAEFARSIAPIDASWRLLVDASREKLPHLKLDRGVELALDDPEPVVSDERVRLAGTQFVLVEFPSFNVPYNSTHPLITLRTAGVTPIVAHPERYENLDSKLEIVRAWKQAGAFLQLNAGSLVGAYGPKIERTAWKCLELGVIDYISSDYHSRGVCLVAAARQRIVARGGEFVFRGLSESNGDRLVAGLPPVPVDPLRVRKSPWARLGRAFRRD